MFQIDGTTIKLTRADYAEIAVTIYDGTQVYNPSGSDTVTFAMKHATMKAGGKQYADTTPIITKTIPIETMVLTMLPEDTAGLDFDTYKYDMEIVKDGKPDTFINNADFVILPEVLDHVDG